MAEAEEDVPEGFEREFWKLVILLNIGPISLAFGAMYVFFEGWGDVPAAAFAVGGVTLVFAARSYRIARSRLEEANSH